MIFNYKAINETSQEVTGTIDAISEDAAINALQKRGFVIESIFAAEEGMGLNKNLKIFDHVSNKDIVILSRQVATLFSAQVSALRIFRLLSTEDRKSVV